MNLCCSSKFASRRIQGVWALASTDGSGRLPLVLVVSCWVAGARGSHFWTGVCSAGPWLGGWRGETLGPARNTDGQRCD